jgi:hypothetical protein
MIWLILLLLLLICGSRSETIVETVINTDGSTTYWVSGAGSAWTVPQYSSLVSYCATYDLCTTSYVYDGTSSDKTGKAIDFKGPSYGGGPWTFTIDMGANKTYSAWRMSGHSWYAFKTAYLNYVNSAGTYIKITSSDVTNTCSLTAGGYTPLFNATFQNSVSSQKWQVYMSGALNTNTQSLFQMYLTEVQFGYTIKAPTYTPTYVPRYKLYIFSFILLDSPLIHYSAIPTDTPTTAPTSIPTYVPRYSSSFIFSLRLSYPYSLHHSVFNLLTV